MDWKTNIQHIPFQRTFEIQTVVLSVEVEVCNPSTKEFEAGRLMLQGQNNQLHGSIFF